MEIENLAGKWSNVSINPATGKTYEIEHIDTREKLEADICECINTRSWSMNHDYMISCLVEWLNRQANISWNNAWKVQKDLISVMQDEIKYLRKVCQTQADSFAAIENENTALRSKLNRIRELAERLQDA